MSKVRTKFSCSSVRKGLGGDKIRFCVTGEFLESLIHFLMTIGKGWDGSQVLSSMWIFLEVSDLHFKRVFLYFIGIESMSHVVQSHLKDDVTYLFGLRCHWNVFNRVFHCKSFMLDNFGFGFELVWVDFSSI